MSPAGLLGAFRCGNKPPVLLGEKEDFSKAKNGRAQSRPKKN